MKIHTAQPRTLEAARALRDSMLKHQVAGVPLRFWPAIIHAETDGYHVCDTGFAAKHGFEIVRHRGVTGEAFDGIRPALRGGYYIPLVDGRQIPAATDATPVTVR